MFEREPRISTVPFDENNHPKLDQSGFLGEEGIQKYQSLIGALQWIISIGRFDIQIAIMTMSSFRAQPYLCSRNLLDSVLSLLTCHNLILQAVLTGPIQCKVVVKKNYQLTRLNDWSNTVYHSGQEKLPTDTLEPLGNPVGCTHTLLLQC